MQISVVYPQIKLGGDPSAVRRIGKAVEDLGFETLRRTPDSLGTKHFVGISPDLDSNSGG